MLKWPGVYVDKRGRRRYNLPPAVSELMAVLDKEVELLKELRKVMFQVRDAVIREELDRLQETIGLERELTGRAEELSRRRDETFSASASCFLNPGEQIATLEELIQQLPEPIAETCRYLSEKIRAVTVEIVAINHTNQVLLASALSFVADSIDLLRGSPGEAGYMPSGRPLLNTGTAAVLNKTG